MSLNCGWFSRNRLIQKLAHYYIVPSCPEIRVLDSRGWLLVV